MTACTHVGLPSSLHEHMHQNCLASSTHGSEPSSFTDANLRAAMSASRMITRYLGRQRFPTVDEFGRGRTERKSAVHIDCRSPLSCRVSPHLKRPTQLRAKPKGPGSSGGVCFDVPSGEFTTGTSDEDWIPTLNPWVSSPDSWVSGPTRVGILSYNRGYLVHSGNAPSPGDRRRHADPALGSRVPL